jgi:hypothetical protein
MEPEIISVILMSVKEQSETNGLGEKSNASRGELFASA